MDSNSTSDTKDNNPLMSNDHNSSVADMVDTTPLKLGGANFRTHKLVATSPSTYVYKPTGFTKSICLSFIIVGLGVLLIYGTSIQNNSTLNNTLSWYPLAFGILFILIGTYISSRLLKPSIFNHTSNVFYKSFFDTSASQKAVPFSEIVALQIISKNVRSEGSSYKSFELNLVLKDATRVNVTGHGNLNSLSRDAETLSQFLKVPVWRATS